MILFEPLEHTNNGKCVALFELPPHDHCIIPCPIPIRFFCFVSDPYCRGAYAGIAMAGSVRHCEAMRTPEWDGCLRFGGDASSYELEGSVPAAIFSGRYTAKRILDFLNVAQQPIELAAEATTPDYPIYEDLEWTKLPLKVRDAALVLGFTPQLWDGDDEPATSDKSWRKLTTEEKQAATVLGYSEGRWNES